MFLSAELKLLASAKYMLILPLRNCTMENLSCKNIHNEHELSTNTPTTKLLQQIEICSAKNI